MTIPDLLGRELRRDGARPLLTWYDGATGARVELSVATASNWAAKIANYVVDELDVQPGGDVIVAPAAHWSTGVVLLGAWTAGAHVLFGEAASLDFAVDPMGLGLSQLVAAQPDQVVMQVDARSAPALTVGARTWSHEELGRAAEDSARHHGIDAAARVLSVLGYDTVDGVDAGLLIPLAAGASVVLVTAVDPERLPELCAAERVTHTAGIDVSGTVRLDEA